MSAANDLAVLIERWLTDRLMRHRGVSSNTIASYRDTFRLLFAFAQTRFGKSPSQLTLRDLDAPFIGAFLEDLETTRSVSVRSRHIAPTFNACSRSQASEPISDSCSFSPGPRLKRS